MGQLARGWVDSGHLCAVAKYLGEDPPQRKVPLDEMKDANDKPISDGYIVDICESLDTPAQILRTEVIAPDSFKGILFSGKVLHPL